MRSPLIWTTSLALGVPGFSERSKSLSVRPASVTVLANEALVEGILDNLIDNALRYGGRTITVELVGRTLSVIDDGPGIPIEAQRDLMQRWAQGPAGQKLGQGAGLGLSIVARYAELLGAELRLEAAEPTGLRVSVTFGDDA